MNYENDDLWEDMRDKEFRQAFSEGVLSSRLASQIYYLRKHRGWTQTDLAKASGKAQPTISELEDSCETATLSTLKKLAAAFDVALDVRFVTHVSLLSDEFAPDREVLSFSEYPHPDRGLQPGSASPTSNQTVVWLDDHRNFTENSSHSYSFALQK